MIRYMIPLIATWLMWKHACSVTTRLRAGPSISRSGSSTLIALVKSRNQLTKMATTVSSADEQYDRVQEVKHFEESKLGVKGLVDTGLSAIPRFFVHPPETLSGLKRTASKPTKDPIATVDLSGVRSAIVDEIARASREFGFFRVVNHGIPVEFLDQLLDDLKGFHEQPAEEKVQFYGREITRTARLFSNVDLFHSKAASWRDTLEASLGPNPPDPLGLPEICRESVLEWSREVKKLGEILMELLCEGLGIRKDRLKEMKFAERMVMVGHYYPSCPQPDLTLGIASHSDPGLLTVLLPNHVGGLQVKHGDEWVDVNPIHGSLVINIGDIFQIMSNEEYKSVDHRVLANGSSDARVSIAVFFNSTTRDEELGPLEELLSPERPAIYRNFTLNDFMTRFFTKELDGKSLVNFYKI